MQTELTCCQIILTRNRPSYCYSPRGPMPGEAIGTPVVGSPHAVSSIELVERYKAGLVLPLEVETWSDAISIPLELAAGLAGAIAWVGGLWLTDHPLRHELGHAAHMIANSPATTHILASLTRRIYRPQAVRTRAARSKVESLVPVVPSANDIIVRHRKASRSKEPLPRRPRFHRI